MLKSVIRRIKNKFKAPEEIEFHPKNNIHIKYVFECGGKNYYQCVNTHDIPIKRFRMLKKFYIEQERKVDSDVLTQFCDKILEHCDKNEMSNIVRLADELKHRTTWAFEIDTLYRFASGTFFTLDEDITDYDHGYNQKKIDAFKKKESILKTILKELVTNSSKLIGLSDQDLQTYLKELREKIETQQKLITS